jgi:hypothetical protein
LPPFGGVGGVIVQSDGIFRETDVGQVLLIDGVGQADEEDTDAALSRSETGAELGGRDHVAGVALDAFGDADTASRVRFGS